MKLAMAPLHADLKQTVALKQGDQFLDFHVNSLTWALDRDLTSKLSGPPPPSLASEKVPAGGFARARVGRQFNYS